jgi:hypothetical protein
MGSRPGRILLNWRGPFGTLCRCYLLILHRRDQIKGRAAARKMHAKMPYFYELFAEEQSKKKVDLVRAGLMPNLNAAVQRLDKGFREGYENEHPDKNERMKKYWSAALKVYETKTQMTITEIKSLLSEVDLRKPVEDFFLYVARKEGCDDQAKIGITKNHANRVNGIQLDVPVEYYRIYRTTQAHAKDVESFIKSNISPGHLRGEWRPLAPAVMAALVEAQFLNWNVEYWSVVEIEGR